jgi:4-amino-4-deoxy-L-arabinose transferase-like glycosyltransferase
MMNLHGPAATRFLRGLQVFFYVALVILWFKGNYPLMRKIPISPVVPLLGLLAATAVRAFAKWKAARPRARIRVTKDAVLVAVLILATAAVHVPYLVHSFGLMDSDEAIPALQGKHIAEGGMPTVFYYAARFQGSFPQHYYALFFKLFGFSAFLTKLAAFLAFAAFLAVQYALLKRLFSREFALAAGLFYVLPFKHLILAGFDVGSGFAVVFLLGSLIFTLTQRIYADGKDHLLGTLGFLLGLTFWTHQITVIFILTSGVFLFLRYKFRIEKYLRLAFYFALGVLPMLVSEIYWDFPIVRALFGGESTGTLAKAKLANGTRLGLELFSSGPGFANVIYLLLLSAGLVLIGVRAVKARKIEASALFAVYAVVYAAVYFLSSFSSSTIIRYLYILYLILPVLFAAAFLWIKPARIRLAVQAAFILLLFAASQAGASLEDFRSIVKHDTDAKAVLAAAETSGQKYWKGDYWNSYLLTALSKERLIVASTAVERYPYYQLLYDTEAPGANRIFLRTTPEEARKAAEFTALLSRLGKTFESIAIEDWLLVYGVRGEVYDKNLLYPPDEVPNVALAGIAAEPSGLAVRFASKAPVQAGGYRMNVEIPGFCALFAPIEPGTEVTVRIPYPEDRKIHLRYFVDFQGLVLDSTIRDIETELPSPPAGAKRDDIEYLSGFGPREHATGNDWQALDREVRFRLNRPLGPSEKITLRLFSPFMFEDIWWHGDFAQVVEILADAKPIARKTLKDGMNTIELAGLAPRRAGDSALIEMKFRYRQVVSSVRDHWKTAAYLDALRID